MFSNSKDLNAEIKVSYVGGGRGVAGGTGDNTKVTGATIDRKNGNNGLYMSALLSYGCRAVLQAAETLKLALELQESADGSNWDTAEVVYATTTVLTGPGGGGTVVGVKQTSFDLSSRKRYVRFNHTPDLSASGTDTFEVIGQVALAGSNLLPAA